MAGLWGRKNSNKLDKKPSMSAKRRQRNTFILEEIITPSVGFPVDSGNGDFCVAHPDLPIVSDLPPLFTLEELGISLGNNPSPETQNYLTELLKDYFEQLQEFLGLPINSDSLDINELLKSIDQQDWSSVYTGLITPPTTEFPNIGGGIDTLPPPVIVPIDPPGSNGNNSVDPNFNNQLPQYNFSVQNQPLIGVIDTGFSAVNPDIDYSRVVLGSDRIDNDNNPLLQVGEGNEHGSHILGIIGATQNNGIGINGINDDAKIWVGRGIGSGQWADSLKEFVDAAKASGQPNGVVNLSLDLTQTNPDGSVTTRYEFTPKEREAIEYARQNHVLIVAAAGNDGGVMSVLGQASQEFDNILTVGASDGNNRAAYSSYGRGLDILAVGGTTENPELSLTGDGLGTMAGTSVATAKVTGAASLVWAANPELNYRQVIEILKSTAKDLSAPGWDEEIGAGLLDIQAAVEKAKVTTPEVYNPKAFLTPNTWGGDGKVTPGERAVNIVNENFTAWVVSSNGINLRNSPNTSDRSNFVVKTGDTLTFDGWTYGEQLSDLTTGEADALWYRFQYNGGTYWVPSAWTGGYPGSRPPLLPPAQAPTQQYQQPPVSQQPTNNTVYLSTDAGEILQVDQSTGASHKIYQGRAFTDLAVAPNGKLYGCTFFDGLYEINPSTGAERYVGPLAGGTLNSLTFSTDGRLYGADQGNGNLFQISPDNGQMSQIGNLGGPSSGDLVFNGANEILATVGSPYTSSDRLVVFNLATGTSRNVGDLGLREVYGLTLENGQLRAYTSDRRKIAIDMNTGATSVIGNVSSQGLIWGAGDIPESLPSATDNVRQKFLYAASLYPQVGNAITGVQDQGGGVFRQEFERAIMIWNGQQVTVYETKGRSASTTSPSSTPQVNNPSGFNPVVFTRSVGVDTNYGIKLRTDTSLNARGEGVTHDSQIEFDGWKYGEPVQDQTVANGQMDALWYRIKGTNYWIPSAFMIGYPPGNPAVLPGGSGGNSSGNGSGSGNSNTPQPISGKGNTIRTGTTAAEMTEEEKLKKNISRLEAKITLLKSEIDNTLLEFTDLLKEQQNVLDQITEIKKNFWSVINLQIIWEKQNKIWELEKKYDQLGKANQILIDSQLLEKYRADLQKLTTFTGTVNNDAPPGADDLKVERGQLTFDVEGNDDPSDPSTYSRKAHWPGGASGVTIGRGYDLGQHETGQILKDLQSAGISSDNATKFSQAAQKTGNEAKNFLAQHKNELPEITREQQKRLFEKVYGDKEDLVKEISNSQSVVDKYGTVNWETLNPAILDMAVDLIYRGDYQKYTREVVQPLIVANDIKGLLKLMKNKEYWQTKWGVPVDRFNRRVAYLEKALAK